jgi:3'(2'), 5'-bisphosphate nucleotidase
LLKTLVFYRPGGDQPLISEFGNGRDTSGTVVKDLEKNNIKMAVRAAWESGQAILEVYQRDFSVEYKDDRSPLTEADKAAHEIICAGLKSTGLPVLSEESKTVSYEQRKNWGRFWLVDPLDGTKEFIKKNGEFTVNIALIDAGHPVLGVVYAPVLKTFYIGAQGLGSFRATDDEIFQCLELAPTSFFQALGKFKSLPLQSEIKNRQSAIRVVASRSHMNPETEAFIAALEKQGRVELVSNGSSLKLCMVAEGRADVYPRIAPTMEWDTAAAQAVVEASGGTVVQYGTNEPLRYNKENLLNAFFVVSGRDYRASEHG